MNFPQYRKLSGIRRYYKITGERHFTERYFLGEKLIENSITATQFPEMLRIQDMLKQELGFVEMDAEEIQLIFGE